MQRQLVTIVILMLLFLSINAPARAPADGKLVRPRNYAGSLEEQSQEAIIVFQAGHTRKSARQDLILKIRVTGEVDNFAWVVPLPNPPETAAEDAALFQELFAYVEARKQQLRKSNSKSKGAGGGFLGDRAEDKVEVLSREVVGSYDVAVVREKQAGALNEWLVENGYQALADAEDVIEFYRAKDYVFACVKVSQAALQRGAAADLHPLRFTFETGGRDGIFFPMKMTGLQSANFDVNLYVFYQAWLNDDLNKYGYTRRGFRLNHRDWDTARCEPNAGKNWSAPRDDPYLRDQAAKIPVLTRYFQKHHPDSRFYLTNLQANGLRPREVRAWVDDLWMFPYYVNTRFVPYDARQGKVAAAAWNDD